MSYYPKNCPHCGIHYSESADKLCLLNQLQPVSSAKHTGNEEVRRSDYTKPTLQELRLGRIIGEAATKWWKVEDWFKRFEERRANPNGYTKEEIEEVFDFIVQCVQEK